jgi:hypothetical protein
VKTVQSVLAEADAQVQRISPEEAKGLVGVFFLDVREPAEVAASGKVPGAVAVPRGWGHPSYGNMPLVLEESQFEVWMRESPERAAEMMKPYSGAIEVWQVSSAVGNVKNNGPELMERVAQEAPALDL